MTWTVLEDGVQVQYMNSGQNSLLTLLVLKVLHTPQKGEGEERVLITIILSDTHMISYVLMEKDPATTANAQNYEKWIEHEIHADLPFWAITRFP